MSCLARSWMVVTAVLVTLIVAAFGAVPVLAGRAGFDLTQWTRASLIDPVLCLFVPEGAPAGFYAEVASAHARMHRAMEAVVRTGNPDRDFAGAMIPHHQGAIDVALVELKYGRDERLRRLAQAIIVEQGQEIAYLKTILENPPATARTASRSGAD